MLPAEMAISPIRNSYSWIGIRGSRCTEHAFLGALAPAAMVPEARAAGRREGVTGVAEIVEVQTLRDLGACLLTG